MPSVYATWHGQCRDKTKREELCLRMQGLGEITQSYFEPPALIKHFNQTIAGNILISKAHFLSPPTSAKLTDADEKYYSIEKINLYGIEFMLNPYSFYKEENRFSFVFCVDDDPLLDGIIVLVEDKQECLKYVEPIIKEADYFLETPNIHLRYLLEDWTDSLMFWVKYHYVRNLRYWRYEDILTDEQTVRNDHFGKFGKYEYYEILRSRLKAELTHESDEEQQDSDRQDLDFRAVVGRTPKEIDDY